MLDFLKKIHFFIKKSLLIFLIQLCLFLFSFFIYWFLTSSEWSILNKLLEEVLIIIENWYKVNNGRFINDRCVDDLKLQIISSFNKRLLVENNLLDLYNNEDFYKCIYSLSSFFIPWKTIFFISFFLFFIYILFIKLIDFFKNQK